MARVRARAPALVLCLATLGCAGSGSKPTPSSTTSPSSTTPAPTTTGKPPSLTAAPIAGLDAAAFHASLRKAGFTTGPPGTTPGFVTTTSTQAGATVSTYGTGPADVVKIIAEADGAAAPSVLVAVATQVAKGPEAKKAETWVKAELKKGPIGPAQPRVGTAAFAKQPFELLVTSTTATLSIGRLTAKG